MQLQTRSVGLKNQKIKVNGRYYDVDRNLCVEVTNEDDIERLKLIGFFEDVNVPGKPSDKRKAARATAAERPKPTSSLADAKHFVALVARDPRVQEQCAKCQTFSELHAYAQKLGYGFTAAQLDQARAAHIQRSNAGTPPEAPAYDVRKAVEADLATKTKEASPAEENTEQPPEDSAEQDEQPAETPSDAPSEEEAITPAADKPSEEEAAEVDSEEPIAILPDGTPADEWPDPEDSMKMDYLRLMADAYEVDHRKYRVKAELIEALKAAMFE